MDGRIGRWNVQRVKWQGQNWGNQCLPNREQIQQSYIMVEWKQPSSFQVTLLVFVPPTDWVSRGRNGSLAGLFGQVYSFWSVSEQVWSVDSVQSLISVQKMSRVYGKAGTLETRARHTIQSGARARGRACSSSEKWMEKHVNGTQGGSQWINRSGDSPFLGLEWWLWAGVWGTQTASLNSPM